MKNLFLICYIGFFGVSRGQVGIGTVQPDPSAVLEVSSGGKGVRLPLISLTSINDVSTVPSPVKGFMAYNQSENGSGFTAVTKGVYTFDGERWHKLLSRQNSTDRIMEIPFLIPIFVADRKSVV